MGGLRGTHTHAVGAAGGKSSEQQTQVAFQNQREYTSMRASTAMPYQISLIGQNILIIG